MTATVPTQRALPGGDYWLQSRRPLVCLAFVAPLLVVYELGVLFLGPSAIRNGADVWLRQLLELAGFTQYFLLPLLTCGILLGWHHATREPWKMANRTIHCMWIESAILAVLLLLAAQLEAQLFGRTSSAAIAAATTSSRLLPARLIGYLGAGIYEELLFRLLLLPACALALRATGLNRRGSWATAVVLTSLIFAAAHYRFDFQLFGWHIALPHGDAFTWYTFSFRCCAGALFGTLFATRGFGIAVGTHAVYDLLVALV